MNNIREDLKAFVDGELSPERMQEVQAAVDADPALRQEVSFIEAVGQEIKLMAAEPEVAGREALVSKFRKPLAPWWDASRLSGRLAYTAGLFVVLAGLSAVLFPVFGQSKQSSRLAMERFRARADQSQGESAAGEIADATTAAPGIRDESGFVEAPQEMAPETFSPTAGGSAFKSSEGHGDDASLAEAKTFSSNNAPAGAESKSADPEVRRNPAPATPPSATRPNAGGSSPPPADVPATNRMVVKNATVDLKVENVEQAMTEAENLARSLGGYTEGSNLTRSEGIVPRGFITLRIPSGSYESAMQSLRQFGEVLGQNSNAVDVTAAHADVQARLKVLKAEEESYVSMLRAARKVGEIMEIKDRLSQIRQQIESYDAQRKALANEAALSTIRATFIERAKTGDENDRDRGGFDETWARAQNGLASVGEFLGNLAIYVFVFSPVWLPPVLLFWWLSRRASR